MSYSGVLCWLFIVFFAGAHECEMARVLFSSEYISLSELARNDWWLLIDSDELHLLAEL